MSNDNIDPVVIPDLIGNLYNKDPRFHGDDTKRIIRNSAEDYRLTTNQLIN